MIRLDDLYDGRSATPAALYLAHTGHCSRTGHCPLEWSDAMHERQRARPPATSLLSGQPFQIRMLVLATSNVRFHL